VKEKMLRTFVYAIVSLLLTTSCLAQQEYAIIVESGSGGANFAWFSTVEGNWMESASKSKAPGLTAPKAMFKTAGSPGAARFTPDIPVEGEYEVFATYPDSGNAVGVIYHVHSASGDKEIGIDQRGRDDRAKPPANTWFSLGKYKFAKGKEGYVEIRDPQTGKGANEKEPNVRIYADAVKFVPVGFTLPPEFAVKAGKADSAKSTLSALPAASEPSAAPQLPVAQPTASSAMPSLPSVVSQPSASNASASSLPALTSVPEQAPAQPALPPLATNSATPSSAAPALPALTEGTASQSPSPAASTVSSLPPLGAPALASAQESAPPALPALGSQAQAVATPAVAASALASTPALQPLSPEAQPAAPAMPVLEAGQSSFPAPTAAPAESVLPNSPQPLPGTLPAAAPTAEAQPAAVPAPSSQPLSGDGLPWLYDEGTAHATARSQNKNVLVFFVADGNRFVQKYENEYFKHPAVREVLNQFVLRKVNFALNTKAAYKVRVYGAGSIAVTDGYGETLGTITQVPATPEEFAQQLKELATKKK
jgi:hypothetical protein